MNLLLDTSFLCGLFNKDDVHHRQAHHMLDPQANIQVFIPSIVMTELLMGDINGKKLFKACKKLCGTFLEVTDKELLSLAEYPRKIRQQLKANDCIIMALAKSHQAELITFDKKLKKAFNEI